MITEWREADKCACGDLMEAVSYGDMSTESSLTLMREAMAAIARAKRELRYPANQWENVPGLVHPVQPVDAGDLHRAVAVEVWGNMLLERHVLTAAVLTRKTMQVLQLPKPFVIHNLAKLWDPPYQRRVHGDAVPRVAATRHKATPQPITQAKIDEHDPLRVCSHGVRRWKRSAGTPPPILAHMVGGGYH